MLKCLPSLVNTVLAHSRLFDFLVSTDREILHFVYKEYRTISGVAGPLVILEKVKVYLFSSNLIIYFSSLAT